MRPTDIAAIRQPGRPTVAPDGTVFFAVTSPDLDANANRSRIFRLCATGGDAEPFTAGPTDSATVLSPDGGTLVFLRAGESGPPQLHAMPVGGGEPRRLTEHPLGAGAAVFDPTGGRIAYCAAVPEAGRYGTDPAVPADAEPPRPITRMSYREDGKGFVIDRREQVHVLDLSGGQGRQVTDEPGGAELPLFLPDGRLAYVRETAPDQRTSEVAVVDLTAAEPTRGDLLLRPGGGMQALARTDDSLLYVGSVFDGVDGVGRNNGLFRWPLAGGTVSRLTDEETVDVDSSAGQPVVLGRRVLVAVADRGRVAVRAVELDADEVPLAELAVVIDGGVVTGFGATATRVAAAVASPSSLGEIHVLDDADSGNRNVNDGVVRCRTDLGRALTAAGLAGLHEISGAAPDGHPVHGFLVLPEGRGPHPVLLLVHGGPHAAHRAALFDEAQVYAGAGYAVVLPNPRGSASYGQRHGRAVVGALGTVDVDDVLALLDVALERDDLDAARVGVMGGSYGGFMTSWLAAHAPERFAAAISERAVNAWDSFAGSSDIGYDFASAYVGDDRETLWRTSPLAYADRIEMPMLIIHSEQDWRCPLEQAQRLFVALRRRGAPAELLLFPGEGHELSRSGKPMHRVQRFDAILAWWERYLPVG